MMFLMLLLLVGCKWDFQTFVFASVAATNSVDDKCNGGKMCFQEKLNNIVTVVNQCQAAGRPVKFRATLAPNAQRNLKPAKRFQICPNVISSSAGNKCEQSPQKSGDNYIIYYHEFSFEKPLLPIDAEEEQKVAKEIVEKMADGAMLADFLLDSSHATALWLLCLDMPSDEKVECKTEQTSHPMATSIAGPTDQPNTTVTSVAAGSTNSITKKLTTTTTMKAAEEICTSEMVQVKPAVIRDRFADLESQCPDLKNPENCTELTDYAVRIGCISCEKGITAEKQTYFLDALQIWIRDVKDWNDLEHWIGTDLCAIFENSYKQCTQKIYSGIKEQTIFKLEAGGFRYVSVPEEWITVGVTMLIHDCGFGKFASAVRQGKPINSMSINPLFDWEQDFVFLEQCKFSFHILTNEQYFYGKNPGKSVGPNDIWFGTIKPSTNPKLSPENFAMTPQQIQAHKFKYGLSDPLRDNKLVGDTVDNYARVKQWGRYIAPPDEMYGEYKKHTFILYLDVLKRMSGARRMTDKEIDNANINVTVGQMEIKCPGNIIHISTRVHAIQEVSYYVQGVPHNAMLILQMTRYNLDNAYYRPPSYNPSPDDLSLCEFDVKCLQEVHLYKYRSIGK